MDVDVGVVVGVVVIVFQLQLLVAEKEPHEASAYTSTWAALVRITSPLLVQGTWAQGCRSTQR